MKNNNIYLIFALIIFVIGLIILTNKPIETAATVKTQFNNKAENKPNSYKKNTTKLNSSNEMSSSDFYNNLVYIEKQHYFMTCFDTVKEKDSKVVITIKNIEEVIENFIKSKESANLYPSELQLSYLKKMHDNCISLLEFKEEIYNEVQATSYRDDNHLSDFSHELMQVSAKQGIDAAIKLAENNLLNRTGNFFIKYDALDFLYTSGTWLENINDNLNLSLSLIDSKTYINSALEIMECDYGIKDCGVNSVMMYDNCLVLSTEFCGMDGLQFFRFSMSEFERSYVDRYISYFKQLNLDNG